MTQQQEHQAKRDAETFVVEDDSIYEPAPTVNAFKAFHDSEPLKSQQIAAPAE